MIRSYLRLALVLYLALFSGILIADNRPTIGITAAFSNEKIQVNYEYVEAVIENGAIPLILPPTEDPDIINEFIAKIDGAVLTGGRDIPPECYGQSQHATTKPMDPQRYSFEKKFLPAIWNSGKPLLGICLGMQFTNVCQGGTMYQDIPSMIGETVCHRNGEMYTNLHEVGIAKGSLLEKVLGTNSTRVISRHHQAVDKPGKNLVVVARTRDGVIEALERSDGKFGLFVQWHPESMKKADIEHRNRLFKALIEAARNK